MPVQWKAKGKSDFLPSIRWYAAANSAFESEKAWPRWSLPFMYGYGKVTRNLPPSQLPSGASTSKAFFSSHFDCAFFWMPSSTSRRAVPFGASAAGGILN